MPWTGLRDYLVRCDACDRPLAICVDRDRILRRHAAPHSPGRDVATAPADQVDELLDTRGTAAFRRRLALAAVGPLAVLAFVRIAAGDSGTALTWAAALALLAIIPSALWGPAAIVHLHGSLRGWITEQRERLRTRLRRQPRQASLIVIERGRWDQWMREEKRRAHDRVEHPDAVLRELERILGDRELRRVRALAERGEVPVEHLEDLLRHRRTFGAAPAA
ncbi:MAG: hypothetical protein ABI200_02500 [Gaiellales bacterium]